MKDLRKILAVALVMLICIGLMPVRGLAGRAMMRGNNNPSRPYNLNPNEPNPNQPDPNQPNPNQPNPNQPDSNQPNPNQPNPNQPDPNNPDDQDHDEDLGDDLGTHPGDYDEYYYKQDKEKEEVKDKDKKDEKKDEDKKGEKAEGEAEEVILKIILTVGSKDLEKYLNEVKSIIKMDIAPYIKNGRTMIPIRYLAEALEMKVTWDEKTRTVLLEDDKFKIEIPVDTNIIKVNGEESESDVKPEIKMGRTNLPIANIARALGLKDGEDILWDAVEKKATIIRKLQGK